MDETKDQARLITGLGFLIHINNEILLKIYEEIAKQS
jgi:hypothetical protein